MILGSTVLSYYTTVTVRLPTDLTDIRYRHRRSSWYRVSGDSVYRRYTRLALCLIDLLYAIVTLGLSALQRQIIQILSL